MATSGYVRRRAVSIRLAGLLLLVLLVVGLSLPSLTRADDCSPWRWYARHACDAPGVWCPSQLSLRIDASMLDGKAAADHEQLRVTVPAGSRASVQESQIQAALSFVPKETTNPDSTLPLNILGSLVAAGCFSLVTIALVIAILLVWQKSKQRAAPVPAPRPQASKPARPPTVEPTAVWGRLSVTGGPARAHTLDLVHPSLTIGRSATNDLVLPDNRVSRKHALIERRAGAVIVTDLGTSNGTFINGRQIRDSQPLYPGAFIRLGNTELTFHPPGGRTVPAPAQRPSVLTSSQPRRLSLDREATVFTIGRGLDCDIVLADRHVSRHHAQIRKEPMVTLVQDLGSTHGTFVNGMRINQPTPLRQGDVIRVGNSELVV